MRSNLHQKWYPIASSADLVPRHVFQAQLLGREFAVWRADDGHVNVWENRCLHRGVRLSIGINNGKELKCQYHGWRYANRTAGCTYIPAHPADAPASTICNNVYPTRVAYGLVWSGEKASGDIPALDGFENAITLRAIPVNAPHDTVLKALPSYAYTDDCTGKMENDDSVTVIAGDGSKARLFVQPCDSNHCVIRGLAIAVKGNTDFLQLLKLHSQALGELRDEIEREAMSQEVPEPMQVDYSLIDTDPSLEKTAEHGGRNAELRVTVAEKKITAEDIVSLRLEPLNGNLPTFQPGAHIDVHLQNGLVRQYSITNGPGETGCYRIGVKKEPDSRGGSKYIHDDLAEGDVLAISSPRNNFPLRRDSVHTIFIAGGIGITPLLSMAQALNSQDLAFDFHYFVQSEAHVAFKDKVSEFDDSLHLHKGLSPEETGSMLREVLKDPGHARNVYICGPGPMLEATRQIASDQGWDDSAVHFEYFKNTTELDTSNSFDIELARSAITLAVPAGKSILEVLNENGVALASSCQQGACGTCRVGVLEGDVLHQDVFLNESEKLEGKSIMTCVSRARSNRLILDI